jgi:hypothetical protein
MCIWSIYLSIDACNFYHYFLDKKATELKVPSGQVEVVTSKVLRSGKPFVFVTIRGHFLIHDLYRVQLVEQVRLTLPELTPFYSRVGVA